MPEPIRLHPITEEQLIAAWQAHHNAVTASALSEGLCAHGSQMMGVVCRLAPNHDGPHNNGEWQWGYDPLAPHVLRPLPPSP